MTHSTPPNRHPASFRDPSGTVFNIDGQIVRGLTKEGAERYLAVKKSGLLAELMQNGMIVASDDTQPFSGNLPFAHYLEHERVPFISYPYEWPFTLLKKAALLHLSIQLKALERNIVLTDASAYNIQFKGMMPIFIDLLSFRPYQEGESWGGHSQFCNQFLNPLLLYALKNIPYQEWYRGAFEGIPTQALAALLPLKSWLSLRSLTHVLLPARSHRSSNQQQELTLQKIKKTLIPKTVYQYLLQQLHTWISQLKPKGINPTLWENYTSTRIYDSAEVIAKKQFIAEFIAEVQPHTLWDLGCNDGEFSELALKNGAKYIIGFDVDLGALDKAVLRAEKNNLNFLPLYQQITNPSPNQGWLLMERTSTRERGMPNALMALAFIHHLAIGHNIPLAEVISWLVDLAPTGIIEFVQKTDPTVQKMLSLKRDIFPSYTEETFVALLEQKAAIIKSVAISKTGRCLYWYQRKA